MKRIPATYWQNYSREELVKLRIKDLDLKLDKSFISPLIKKVTKELSQKGINIKVRFWISNEWFTPDGTLGIAVPFFLLHPKLIELERNHVGYAEGETEESCLKILRHELGHVVDNAYGLRRKKSRTLLFGKSSSRYPTRYTYSPYSKNYVRYLEDGYAQAHPVEDFAETFAVWLDPKSNWKSKYRNWPCLKKLLYVDSLMSSLSKSAPIISNHLPCHPVEDMEQTIENYYKRKRKIGEINKNGLWDHILSTIFGPAGKIRASSYIQAQKKRMAQKISRETNIYQYHINRMLDEVISRSNELDLYVKNDENKADHYLSSLLKAKAPEYLKQGKHLIYL